MSEKKKIAVIDDDEVFQLIIKKQIEMKNIECDILNFFNGQEAIDFFKKLETEGANGNAPDLVMLDVNMPVKDGWGFLEDYAHISTDIKSKISLYMVTSSVIQSDIDRAGSNEDIVGFVSKPLTNEKLEEIFS
ncbi:MAG: response regulator [Reichenbachiella sp.]|uniref:response regulator n=1 Tax=Reichenbachiella sp. TaxID=2184521 RepID=UPI002966466A|nr:response regulator [Reichenbachiella sp.]MDW3209027.1 response regulator [Reichenbachiella sp.]